MRSRLREIGLAGKVGRNMSKGPMEVMQVGRRCKGHFKCLAGLDQRAISNLLTPICLRISLGFFEIERDPATALSLTSVIVSHTIFTHQTASVDAMSSVHACLESRRHW
jgi:hypothetical protein